FHDAVVIPLIRIEPKAPSGDSGLFRSNPKVQRTSNGVNVTPTIPDVHFAFFKINVHDFYQTAIHPDLFSSIGKQFLHDRVRVASLTIELTCAIRSRSLSYFLISCSTKHDDADSVMEFLHST